MHICTRKTGGGNMSEHIDYQQLYRIAKSYYLDNLSQEQIAKCESISRPHVSRMLTKARECGIVSIHVQMLDFAETRHLEEALRNRLDLKEVILASVPPQSGDTGRELSLGIATVAAAEMPRLLAGAKNVGVGWGYTLYQTSVLMEQRSADMPEYFIPLIGLSGENTPYLQINVIANRFAEKCDAKSYFTIMPLIRDSNERQGRIEKESCIRFKRQWDSLDTAVIGLGPKPEKGALLVAEASAEYNERLITSGTVGDILANFFFEDGSLFDTSKYYLQISMEPEALKKLKTVICIAGGFNKVEGLIAAARSQYYNVLVSDTNTARLILARLENQKEEPKC